MESLVLNSTSTNQDLTPKLVAVGILQEHNFTSQLGITWLALMRYSAPQTFLFPSGG